MTFLLYVSRLECYFTVFCHVACVVVKVLCSRLWRPVFCSVYLMYTADVKYFNGLFNLWEHHEFAGRRVGV